MQLGEVVELGRHRLMCGDAFNPEHVDLLMQGEKPDLLYMDPPYGMNLETTRAQATVDRQWRATAETFASRSPKDYSAVIGDDTPFDPSSILDRFHTVREQFWWGADYYRARLPDGGSWIVWDKRLTESLDRRFGSCFELCWSRTPHKRDIARVTWAGVLGMVAKEGDDRRYHPTQKPVRLAEWFLTRYSKEDALVVDLFAGSGGTLLGCERTNRRCFTMELSPEYCDVVIDRYEKLTAQPRLIA